LKEKPETISRLGKNGQVGWELLGVKRALMNKVKQPAC
jgi:hypothetical protein